MGLDSLNLGEENIRGAPIGFSVLINHMSPLQPYIMAFLLFFSSLCSINREV